MQKEIWKDIEGYEGIYQVSNFGNIKRLHIVVKRRHRNGKINDYHMPEIKRKTCIGKRGYYVITLNKNKVVKTHYVHRIFAIAFIPNPQNKPQINHKNGIRLDNRLENLEWCTNGENVKHSYDYLNRKPCNKDVLNHPSNKKIAQLDLNNNVIMKYFSAKEVSRVNGYCHSGICTAARNGRVSYGYRWKYI